MKKYLVIQTSFIGDVILATALIEKLHAHNPTAQIDICLRQGNESLFIGHPFLRQVHIWNKKKNKYKNLWLLSKEIREKQYDVVLNLQRFASSGFLTLRSGAAHRIGFKKNPLSFFFTKSFAHDISDKGTLHEVERNQKMIEHITDKFAAKPKLYPSDDDYERAKRITNGKKYITISPASVWYTKQLPKEKWIELLDNTALDIEVFILGGPGDRALGDEIAVQSKHTRVTNLCGQSSLLGSAAFMRDAFMNYVNDSAPLHLCSAVNAPVTAFFCSTVPAFGFTPLSDHARVIETKEKLDCRPCGLHGFKTCPKGHFKCGDIDVNNL